MGILFKKPALINNFPEGFVDIHTHVIPNIDDGSKNLEESLLIVNQLKTYGVKRFICTPHIMEGVWENSHDMIDIKFKELKNYLDKHGLQDIEIRAAAEYMLDDNFRTLLKAGNLKAISGNKVLIELNYFNPPMDLYDLLFDMQMADFKPVLAHPERYPYLIKNFDELEKLKKAGCQFQLNLLSLTNYYGKPVQKTAIKILKSKLYDYVGTDIHNVMHLGYLKKIKGKRLLKLLKPLLINNVSLS